MRDRKRQARKLKLVRLPKRLMRPDLDRRLPRPQGGFQNLTGHRNGWCTVLGLAGFIGKYSHWLCRCDCGRHFLARGSKLVATSTGCGCRQIARRSHGETGTVEHTAWMQMHQSYPQEVCRRWQSYPNFLADVGRRPSPQHALGRIDRRRPFSPSNAGWQLKADIIRAAKGWSMTVGAVTLATAHWAERIGLTPQRLRMRIATCQRLGADISQALTTSRGRTMPCTAGRVGRPRKRRNQSRQ